MLSSKSTSKIPEKQQPKDTKVSDLIEIPKELQAASNQELTDNKNELILKLKEIHMKQQSQLVRQIKIMSEDSKKIIDDITVIQNDIDKYQSHIDQWIKKIDQMTGIVSKIKSTKDPFKAKAANIYKIRDYLQKQIKKNR